MKKILVLFAVILVALIFTLVPVTKTEQPQLSIGNEENPNARDEYEFLVQRDPVSNSIPKNIYRLEEEFAKRIPARESFALAKGSSVQSFEWTERGPYDVGGRTRTFAVDVEHSGTLIAGGVD